MKVFAFLSRVALLCNICYILAIVGRHVKLHWINANIISTIVVLGLVGVFLNIVVNIFWVYSVATRKNAISMLLGFINFTMLIFQVINSLYYQL